MTLEDAVSLVLFAFQNGKAGDIFVQKSPSTTIGTLAKTMKKFLNLLSKLKILGYDMLKKSMKPYFQKREWLLKN